MPKHIPKKLARKKTQEEIWKNQTWRVCRGTLVRSTGHPGTIKSLFTVVAEKLPFDCIESVRKSLKSLGLESNGVYVAHDSMGYARYVGRGAIFSRLKDHFKAHRKELVYFSFYVVEHKLHEKEVETLLIRAGGPHLHFNKQKKRVDIEAGNVRDFAPGSHFFERQKKFGPRSKN